MKTIILLAVAAPALVSAQTGVQSTWGQCGGIGYTGPTLCPPDITCTTQNSYYAACWPTTLFCSTSTSLLCVTSTYVVCPTTTSMGSMTTPTVTVTSTITNTPLTTQATTTATTTRGVTTQYPPLNTLMKSRGKLYVGFAVDGSQMASSNVLSIIHTESGFLTPPNVMSWEIVEPLQSSFYFTQSDQFMTFALQNGQKVRGFPLLWHNKLPAWVQSITNRSVLTSVIQNHITALVSRYKGYVYSWDIATEVLSDTGGIKPTVFSQVFGDFTFLDVAFRAAKAADPNVRLCLNENYIDYPGVKLNAFVNLVKDLKSRNVPIDCIGTETHTQVGFGGIPYFESTLQQLSTTGCEIHITQLDIATPSSGTASAAVLAQQSADYKTIVSACMRTSACAGITMWGVSDRESPLTGLHPLLWDENYQKKPAYSGFVDGILSV
ncbi:Exoglucanase [Arthrobotrys entomopaga]|nr:Exoglucanase [Arthrobotrys entomopaga]